MGGVWVDEYAAGGEIRTAGCDFASLDLDLNLIWTGVVLRMGGDGHTAFYYGCVSTEI